MRALCTNSRLQMQWANVRYELRFVDKHPQRAEMLDAKLTEFEAEMRRGPGWTDRVQWSVTCGPYEIDGESYRMRGHRARLTQLRAGLVVREITDCPHRYGRIGRDGSAA